MRLYTDECVVDSGMGLMGPCTTKSNQDPYPWLDKEDPHRFHTDNKLIESKIDLSISILTLEEKTEVVEMLKQKQEAFSLRDEIGTCPYFEVKLEL